LIPSKNQTIKKSKFFPKDFSTDNDSEEVITPDRPKSFNLFYYKLMIVTRISKFRNTVYTNNLEGDVDEPEFDGVHIKSQFEENKVLDENDIYKIK
jgi:hypothetical protein